MTINIEICCALPERTLLFNVRMEEGSTVADALEASGMRDALPGLGEHAGRVGIYGKLTGLQQQLQAGDRVEIYRPLLIDPKETRRSRAKRR